LFNLGIPPAIVPLCIRVFCMFYKFENLELMVGNLLSKIDWSGLKLLYLINITLVVPQGVEPWFPA
jgi:hypothetical protein